MDLKGFFGLTFASLFVSAAVLAAPKIELLDAEEFGTAWPFIAEEMHLLCMPGNAVVVSDPETGVMYPVNGIASGKARQLALEPLEKVWRDNPELPGTKVSVGPVIERGLKLCTG